MIIPPFIFCYAFCHFLVFRLKYFPTEKVRPSGRTVWFALLLRIRVRRCFRRRR